MKLWSFLWLPKIVVVVVGADAIGDFVIFSVDNDAIRSMHAVSERTSAKSGARLDN